MQRCIYRSLSTCRVVEVEILVARRNGFERLTDNVHKPVVHMTM